MFTKRGQHDQQYIADYLSDLAELPKNSMGSTCWVIETAEKYMINSKGEWILQTVSTNGRGTGGGGSSDADLSAYATIVYSDSEDAKVLAHSDAKDVAMQNQINDIEEESTVWGEIPRP